MTGSSTVSSGRRAAALHALALLALLAPTLYWARPYHDWDLLPYLAVARRLGGASPTDAWEDAYRTVSESVPPVEYGWLTTANGYRRIVAEDPGAFAQQLQFYEVKPVYPALIHLVERLGMDGVDASLLISRASWLATGLVLLAWAAALLPPVVAVLTTWGAMSLPFALDLARLSTPDALSTLLVLAALWLLFARRRFAPAAALLLLSTAVRPDNLLWLLAAAGYGALRHGRRRGAAAFAAAGLLLVLALVRLSGYVGWEVLFHHSFVERLPYPETFEPSLSLRAYLRVLLRETHPVNLPPFLLVFGITGAALFASRLRRYGRDDPGVGVVAVAAVFAAAHWLVFPEGDRFFAAPYLVVVVLLVATLTARPSRAPPETTSPEPVGPAPHP